MRERRGFTLIELLVAMSLFAVIVPVAGWMIYSLLRAQTASADSLADALTLSRFAGTFRSDVHAARSVKADGERPPASNRLLFQFDPPRTIAYVADADGAIVRTVRNAAQIERREEFRLAGTQTRFELAEKEGAAVAVHAPRGFTLSGRAVTTGNSSIIRIEAVIGRDRRFQQPPAQYPASQHPHTEHTKTVQPSEPPAPALPMPPSKKGKRS